MSNENKKKLTAASRINLNSSADLKHGLYCLDNFSSKIIKTYVFSSPESRAITNNPFIIGTKYTNYLKQACSDALKTLKELKLLNSKEKESVVFNILRGGLNFSLREALADSFSWNLHSSSFVSAQREYSKDSNEWLIKENTYSKVFFPKIFQAFMGDVVATGTSLTYALNSIVEKSREQSVELSELTFFTIGGEEAVKRILSFLEKINAQQKIQAVANIIFFDACFDVADETTNLKIQLEGTDLIRTRTEFMAPEFIESQYENPAYPLERCAIYDAGSRAFWVKEYLEDVIDYWEKVHCLAKDGLSFEEMIKERFPALDSSLYKDCNLLEISLKQVEIAKSY